MADRSGTTPGTEHSCRPGTWGPDKSLSAAPVMALLLGRRAVALPRRWELRHLIDGPVHRGDGVAAGERVSAARFTPGLQQRPDRLGGLHPAWGHPIRSRTRSTDDHSGERSRSGPGPREVQGCG